jgi:catechol 2,3-dioxygenase-like lactoylglutathione lyase family enzyme
MRDFRDAKTMAATLRDRLAADGQALTHSRALELVAALHGLRDWNTLAAVVGDATQPRFTETCPILRIFDEAKARAFYLDWLGFTLDWEHRFAPDMPLYAQISRAGLVLHLSMHHGDATPGSCVFVRMTNIRSFHAEITARHNPMMRPGLESLDWGLQVEVTDPFMNRIRFCEAPG